MREHEPQRERRQVQADAFEWIASQTQRRFDLIILDPPSLAKREAERRRALAAYGKLNGDALGLLKRGGVLVSASCSAHVSSTEFFGVVTAAVSKSGRPFEVIETTEHAPDHPATFPEARYLKCIYVRLRD